MPKNLSFEIKKKDFLWGLGVVLFVVIILFASFRGNDFNIENKNNYSFEEKAQIIVADNVYRIGNGRIEIRPQEDGFSEISAYYLPEEYSSIVFTNRRTNTSITERIINGEIKSKIEAEENDIILFTIK